jgi:hypothetical protein
MLDAWEQGKDFEAGDCAAGADIEAQDIVDPHFSIGDAPSRTPASDEGTSVMEQPEGARGQSFFEHVGEPYRLAADTAQAQDIADPQFSIEDAPLQGPASDEDMSVMEQPEGARGQSFFEDVREPYRPAADTAEAQDLVDSQFRIEDAPLQGPASDEDISVTEQLEEARDQSLFEDVREPYRPAADTAEAQDIVDPQFSIEDAPSQGPVSDEDMSVMEQPEGARDQSLFEHVPEPNRPAADTAENRFASHIARGMWKIKNQ